MLRKLSLRAFPVISRGPSLVLKQDFNSYKNSLANMQKESKYKITISVDGNISSGKSTLVSKLREVFPNEFNFHVDLVPEPLEKWTDLRGQNLLGMFYDDPIKNNFMFQNYVQLTRLMETIKSSSPTELDYQGVVRIMERSLQNNMYCFIELAKREGKLEQAEFAVLSEWYKWLEEKFDLNLDLIIYLRTTPETVYNRMQKRGRQEESSVPLEYLQNLHETYEEWLVKGKLGSSPVCTHLASESLQNSNVLVSGIHSSSSKPKIQKVVVIDANQGKQEVATDCSNYLRKFMGQVVFNKTDQQRSDAINDNGN